MSDDRYRVDILLVAPSAWVEYTSRKKLQTLEAAEAFFTHLQRNKTGARIVEVISKKEERIEKEWLPESSKTQKSA